jgi:hypothetical protein
VSHTPTDAKKLIEKATGGLELVKGTNHIIKKIILSLTGLLIIFRNSLAVA